MPPRPRRTATRRMGSARRRLVWATTDTVSTPTVIGTSNHFVNVDLLGTFRTVPGATTLGATVMRTHLRLWPSTTVTAGDQVDIGVGAFGTNELTSSIATGVGFVNPRDFPNVDWMLSDQWRAIPSYGRTGPNNEFDIDIRSRRKLHELQDTLILSIVSSSVTASLSMNYFARVLLALA